MVFASRRVGQPLNSIFIEVEFPGAASLCPRGGAKGADVASNSHDFLPSGLHSGMGRDRQFILSQTCPELAEGAEGSPD